MSLINFGGGLAAMGQAVSDTAGQGAIAAQKSQLEQQRDVLASQLAEGRESRLETQKAGAASALSTQQSGERTSEYKSQKEFDLQQLPAVAKAQQDITEAQASDPKYVKALRTMTDAKATPEQRAAAGLYTVQAAGAKIANAANQELLDARQALSAAQASGDPEQMKKAEGQMYTAQYSMHDEVQRAAVLAQQETNDRLNTQAIQTQIDAIDAKRLSPEVPLAPAAEATRALLVQELAIARENYQTSHAMAQKAASQIPSFNPDGQGGGMINQAPKPAPAAPAAPTKPPPQGFNIVTP